jgi:hypothetical protein
MMEDKHKRRGKTIKIEDQVMVLDSIDGAEHQTSKKSITSVISFSSLLCNPSWINRKSITAGSSLNILT